MRLISEDEFIWTVQMFRQMWDPHSVRVAPGARLAFQGAMMLCSFGDSVPVYEEPKPVSGEINNSTVLT